MVERRVSERWAGGCCLAASFLVRAVICGGASNNRPSGKITRGERDHRDARNAVAAGIGESQGGTLAHLPACRRLMSCALTHNLLKAWSDCP
jgi:hypothetical protein